METKRVKSSKVLHEKKLVSKQALRIVEPYVVVVVVVVVVVDL